MKTKILVAAGMFLSFVAGGIGGYFLRKRQEVSFEECSEEELQAYAESHGYSESADEKKETSSVNTMASGTEDGQNSVDTRKIDYTKFWTQKKGMTKEIMSQIDQSFASYGKPGDEESTEVTDLDLDEDFQEGIENVTDEEDDPDETGEDEEEETEDETPELLVPGEVIPSSDNEFYDGSENAIKVTIFWYTKDGTVTKLDGEDSDLTNEVIVEDPVKEFGFSIPNEFSKCREDELDDLGEGKVLYRANPHKRIHYMIVRYPSSYRRRKVQEEFGGGGIGNVFNQYGDSV